MAPLLLYDYGSRSTNHWNFTSPEIPTPAPKAPFAYAETTMEAAFRVRWKLISVTFLNGISASTALDSMDMDGLFRLVWGKNKLIDRLLMLLHRERYLAFEPAKLGGRLSLKQLKQMILLMFKNRGTKDTSIIFRIFVVITLFIL